MYNNSNPAQAAAMGNLPGMSLIAGGVGHMLSATLAGLDSIDQRIRDRRYNDALDMATSHAREMEDLARTAVVMVAELEAEVASLRAACAQRTEVIAMLKGR